MYQRKQMKAYKWYLKACEVNELHFNLLCWFDKRNEQLTYRDVEQILVDLTDRSRDSCSVCFWQQIFKKLSLFNHNHLFADSVVSSLETHYRCYVDLHKHTCRKIEKVFLFYFPVPCEQSVPRHSWSSLGADTLTVMWHFCQGVLRVNPPPIQQEPRKVVIPAQ